MAEIGQVYPDEKPEHVHDGKQRLLYTEQHNNTAQYYSIDCNSTIVRSVVESVTAINYRLYEYDMSE